MTGAMLILMMILTASAVRQWWIIREKYHQALGMEAKLSVRILNLEKELKAVQNAKYKNADSPAEFAAQFTLPGGDAGGKVPKRKSKRLRDR